MGPQHRPWRLADGAVRPTDHRLVSGAAVILESEDEHFGKKIVGFDIGESSVKLVYFAGADLKKAVTAELPDNMVSGSRILSMDAMADFLRQTAKSNGIPLTHAGAGAASTEVFTRELVMPAMTEQSSCCITCPMSSGTI